MDNSQQPPIQGGAQPLPDKKFFKIGEAADLVGVKPYILRYWESEFKSVRPRKTSAGHRKYSHDDIHLLRLIKNLLYEQMFTIAGARQALVNMQQHGNLNGVAAEVVEPGFFEDPLEGTRLVALEQEKEALTARLDALSRERARALETAQLATDALREVEMAHEKAQAEAEALRARLEGQEKEQERLLDEVQSELDNALMENERLNVEMAHQLERIEALTADLAAAQERPAVASASPSESADGVASSDEQAAQAETGGRVVQMEELRQAREALEKSRKAQRDLEVKLRYESSRRQRILKDVRAQVISLRALAQPAGR